MGKLKNALTGKIAVTIYRVLIGAFFIFTGVLKVSAPWQEFATVISKYEVLPPSIIPAYAQVLPWAEILVGATLIFRILPVPSVLAVVGMLLMFEIATISAILRGIDLRECGCFAGLNIPDTPPITIVRNLFFLAMLYAVYRFEKRAASDSEEDDADNGLEQSSPDN